MGNAPGPGSTRARRPSRLHLAKLAEVERLRREGVAQIDRLSEREFLIAGVALYAGEGMKTDGRVGMANTDPRIVHFFVSWLRRFFDVPEAALRLKLYLHEDLDLEVAVEFWSCLTGIPRLQFGKPYRAVADPSRRERRHEMGCPAVVWNSTTAHRQIMGFMDALLSSSCFPG